MVKYLEPLIFWEVGLPFDKNKKIKDLEKNFLEINYEYALYPREAQRNHLYV